MLRTLSVSRRGSEKKENAYSISMREINLSIRWSLKNSVKLSRVTHILVCRPK